MIDTNVTFETEQLLLRPIRKEDYLKFRSLTIENELWEYFTHDLSQTKTLQAWVENAILEMTKGKRLALTILDKATNQVIGSTSIGNLSIRDYRAEIGWTWLSKSYQGCGINSQCKYLLLAHCFDTLELERVEFKTDVLNLKARKALKKLGAFEEGILRSHTLMSDGRRRDTIYYSILKSEWPTIKYNLNQ